CGERRRIVVTRNGSRTAGHFVTGDGYPFTRAFRKVNILTYLDDRRPVVGDGQGEAGAFACLHASLVSHLRDAQVGLAIHRNRRRIVVVVFRIGFRIFIRTPYVDTVGDGPACIRINIGRDAYYDRSTHGDGLAGGHRGGIATAIDRTVATGHFITRDGYAGARTFCEADYFAAADH